MKTMLQFFGSRRMIGRKHLLGIAVLVMTLCMQANPVHAQRRPPTIPNSNGSVTIQSTVGGPNAIAITLGGPQTGQIQHGQPAPMTFGPAISPPPQQAARIYYVYYRQTPEYPWRCLGGYYSPSNAQQSVNWLRHQGSEAFYR